MSADLDSQLAAIFAQADELGIDLTLKPERSVTDKTDRMAEAFEEILRFVDEHGREPVKCMNINERMLAVRLNEFRMDAVKAAHVRHLDRHGLLPPSPEAIDEIIADSGSTNILNAEDDIFNVSSLPKRKTPDYVSRRKPCKDFEKFEEIFKTCHRELCEGKRHTSVVADGKQSVVYPGDFVLLKGALVYVAEKGETYYTKTNEPNARLRLIFENGTESDMLMRSLFTGLYDDGRMISKPDEKELSLSGCEINDEDCASGYIYVLKSLSTEPQITAIPNLYKIGLTTDTVESRIANACHEATYLMADVDIVYKCHCYNINIHTMENLIHKFFSAACMEIEIHDQEGNLCHPREWFSVPLGIIEQVIDKLVNGSITQYHYDHERGVLEKKIADPDAKT